jgi:hypothetical protein
VDDIMPQQDNASRPGYSLAVRGPADHRSEIEADAVIFGSGWSTGKYPIFDREQLEELGLPVEYTDCLPEREKGYQELDKSTLSNLLSSLRTLRDMPKEWGMRGFSARFGTKEPPKYAPYRLYRLMVPLDSLYDRDIAFAGIPTCKGEQRLLWSGSDGPANHVLFICQAHWITDYLLGLLPNLPSKAIAKQEISMQTVWAQRLFGPSHGRLGQWLGATWIEYCSRLCWGKSGRMLLGAWLMIADMGVADDGKGWNGVVDSDTYDLERKRTARDNRGLVI